MQIYEGTLNFCRFDERASGERERERERERVTLSELL
jgi:hypothetical protein